MKINTPLLLLVPFVLLPGCVPSPQTAQQPPARQPHAPAPKPYYLPPTQPAPAPAPSAKPAPAGWRDAAQTPGAWTYAAESGGSAARFGVPGAAPLLVMRCDRTRPAVLIQRPSAGSGQGSGQGSATIPAAITTSSVSRRLGAVAAPGSSAAQNAPLLFEITLGAADPLLDGIAFSRGRFMVEMSGAPTLYLPAWAEIGRLIEDCR